MKIIEKVVVSTVAPTISNALWIDVSGDKPKIKIFHNGEYVSPVEDGSSAHIYDSESSLPKAADGTMAIVNDGSTVSLYISVNETWCEMCSADAPLPPGGVDFGNITQINVDVLDLTEIGNGNE